MYFINEERYLSLNNYMVPINIFEKIRCDENLTNLHKEIENTDYKNQNIIECCINPMKEKHRKRLKRKYKNKINKKKQHINNKYYPVYPIDKHHKFSENETDIVYYRKYNKKPNYKYWKRHSNKKVRQYNDEELLKGKKYKYL